MPFQSRGQGLRQWGSELAHSHIHSHTYRADAVCESGVGAGAMRHSNLPFGEAGNIIGGELAAMRDPGIVLVPPHAPTHARDVVH